MLSLAKPGQVWQVCIFCSFLFRLFQLQGLIVGSICKFQCFLAQGVGLGMGTGLTYVPSVAIASQYFPRRESSAVAMIFVTAGTPLGAVIHPIMLNKLFSNPNLSFGTAMRISAGFVTLLLVIGCCCMRQRNPPPENLPSVVKVFAKAVRDKAFGCMCIS
jgi:MFS family permease